jgi:hypothetical protein
MPYFSILLRRVVRGNCNSLAAAVTLLPAWDSAQAMSSRSTVSKYAS